MNIWWLHLPSLLRKLGRTAFIEKFMVQKVDLLCDDIQNKILDLDYAYCPILWNDKQRNIYSSMIIEKLGTNSKYLLV